MEATEEYNTSKSAPASSAFTELIDLIMTEDEIEIPTNADKGLVLYRYLTQHIAINVCTAVATSCVITCSLSQGGMYH